VDDRRLRKLPALLGFLPIVFLIASPSRAQSADDRRCIVGGQVSTMPFRDENGLPTTSVGVGPAAECAVSRRLTLGGDLVWFPSPAAAGYEDQGGRTLKVMGGASATFARTGALRLYGLSRAGLLRVSDTMFNGADRTVVSSGARNHLALELGGGVDWTVRQRLSARVQLSQTLYTVPSVTLFGGPADPTEASVPARIAATTHLSASLGYRLGPPAAFADGPVTDRKWSAGGGLTTWALATIGDRSPLYNPGISGFVSYRVVRLASVEGTTAVFFRTPSTKTPWDGGRSTIVLGGVKFGSHTSRAAMYAKARAGVVSNTQVYESRDSKTGVRGYGRATMPTFDLGGIVEFEPSRASILRVELGDLLTVYGTRQFLSDGQVIPQVESPRQSIQLSWALGWRF
jgi:hypothetical protein